MTNTSLRSLIETIEQKEQSYKQHSGTIKSNFLAVCDHFKNKFTFQFEGDIFYKSDLRDDINYSLSLRTSSYYGFEVVKRFDDGDIIYISPCDFSTKILRIIIDDNIIEKLLKVYLIEISRIESLYIELFSRSQILKEEITNNVIESKL